MPWSWQWALASIYQPSAKARQRKKEGFWREENWHSIKPSVETLPLPSPFRTVVTSALKVICGNICGKESKLQSADKDATANRDMALHLEQVILRGHGEIHSQIYGLHFPSTRCKCCHCSPHGRGAILMGSFVRNLLCILQNGAH